AGIAVRDHGTAALGRDLQPAAFGARQPGMDEIHGAGNGAADVVLSRPAWSGKLFALAAIRRTRGATRDRRAASRGAATGPPAPQNGLCDARIVDPAARRGSGVALR